MTGSTWVSGFYRQMNWCFKYQEQKMHKTVILRLECAPYDHDAWDELAKISRLVILLVEANRHEVSRCDRTFKISFRKYRLFYVRVLVWLKRFFLMRSWSAVCRLAFMLLFIVGLVTSKYMLTAYLKDAFNYQMFSISLALQLQWPTYTCSTVDSDILI